MKDLFCFIVLLFYLTACSDSNRTLESELGAPDKPCGVGRADANPKLLLNDT